MSAGAVTSDIAFRVADLLRSDAAWEVFGERSRRFELHLQGTEVELERGPITVEGYGLRLLRPREKILGSGFQASTDASPAGVATTVEEAETSARYGEFPASSVELPRANGAAPSVSIVDPKLWVDPLGALRGYLDVLLGAFDGRKGTGPSFGSVKAVLTEVTIANSAGLRVSYPATRVDLELAVKASGGPEGRPPGEYWANESFCRLEPDRAKTSVETWCRAAQDVRKSVPPPNGELPVVLPADVLAGILPAVIGTRLSGTSRLRKIAPEVGTKVGVESLTIRDEGDYPWSPGSSPYDDEGTARSKLPIIQEGKIAGHFYDALYATALGTKPTGSAFRSGFGPPGGIRFTFAPAPEISTLVVSTGDGGSLSELVAAAGDGILVTQLGWANPDPLSGEFGGEIRIGYRIEGGKLAEPVRGGTVGGVVFAPPGKPSMFANLAAIGSTADRADDVVSPALLVKPLSVAGA